MLGVGWVGDRSASRLLFVPACPLQLVRSGVAAFCTGGLVDLVSLAADLAAFGFGNDPAVGVSEFVELSVTQHAPILAMSTAAMPLQRSSGPTTELRCHSR